MEIIKLNIIPNGVTPVCHASQFDVKRKIRAELFELNDPYTLSGEETVTLNVRKPDKTIVTMTLTNTADNYVEFETTEQMCAVYGENKCEIKISYDDMTIGSLNFIMQVERDPLYQGITSESEIENLQTQVDTAVAVAVATQYDSSNVIFDTEPTLNNDIPYTVTSDGIKRALNDKADLSALQAQNISYDNTQSGLTATDAQEAIDEVLGEIPTIPSTYAASAITYDNTSSGLTADDVQDAIDELKSDIPSIPSSYAASAITYDNTSSGLTADDVQDAIDETAVAINGKADKSTSVTITPATDVTVIYNSSVKTDKAVVCACAFEKTGGWASGWQTIATIGNKPTTDITVSVTNASTGGAIGMGHIYSATGEIAFYTPSASNISIALSFCYATT